MKKAVLIAAAFLFTLVAAGSFADTTASTAPAQGKKAEHTMQKPAVHKTQAKHVNHTANQKTAKKTETKPAQ